MNTFFPPNVAPTTLNPTVFLAGTIDNGNSVDWQSEVTDRLKDLDVHLYNPRRVDWDSTWEPTTDNPEFNRQVVWELTHLERCNIVFLVFLSNSASPISLLELGLFSHKCIVVCPDDFYRSGNVKITCDRYDVPVYSNLEDGIDILTKLIKAGV